MVHLSVSVAGCQGAFGSDGSIGPGVNGVIVGWNMHGDDSDATRWRRLGRYRGSGDFVARTIADGFVCKERTWVTVIRDTLDRFGRFPGNDGNATAIKRERYAAKKFARLISALPFTARAIRCSLA
jgi:hypothetical protein